MNFDRAKLFQDRHAARIIRYEERTNAYALLVIQIVSAFNGGSILALLSFIAARKEKAFIGWGVTSLSLYGLALLFVLAAVVCGFFFNSMTHSLFGNAPLNEDGDDFADAAELEKEIEKARARRMDAICLMTASVILTVLAAIAGFIYLVGALL